jgi:ketosteroid isomerase-like protein
MSADAAGRVDLDDRRHAVLQAYFDGINEERYADVGALFAPDGVLVAPGVPPRRGPAEIAPYFSAALKPYPVHRDEPIRTVLADGTAMVEITFTGALASGAPMTFDAVDVFDFDGDGRIARLVTWYDSHLVRARLAAAQAVEAPSPAERASRGSFAEATPARVRAALREVRRGRSVGVGDAARWRGLPPATGPIAARTVLLDLKAGDEVVVSGADEAVVRGGHEAVVRGGREVVVRGGHEAVLRGGREAVVRGGDRVGLHAGDVLLVRTGERAAALPALPRVALAAVALDAELVGAPPVGLVVGDRWALREAPRVGLLVSVPDGAGGANAAVWY